MTPDVPVASYHLIEEIMRDQTPEPGVSDNHIVFVNMAQYDGVKEKDIVFVNSSQYDGVKEKDIVFVNSSQYNGVKD
jgi:hypothetical protein